MSAALRKARVFITASDTAAVARRAGAIALVIRLTSAALAYIAQVVFARLMGQYEYGVFAYTWVWAGAEAHEETYVAWSVEPNGNGGTEIRMVHDGWAEAGLDGTVRDDHERYWAGYLEDLASVLAERA